MNGGYPYRSPLVQNYGVDHIFNSSYLSWEIPLANMATLQGPDNKYTALKEKKVGMRDN